MENEWVKAALIVLGLKDGATLAEVRSTYLAKTSGGDFAHVILGDDVLEKKFIKYYKAYITLLKNFSQSDSQEELSYYPPDQILQIHFNQGLYFLLNQEYLKAVDKFEEAHRIDKKHSLVLIYKGIMLIKRKNYYAAEKYFLEVIKHHPRNDDAFFYLAEAYEKAKQYRKALTMYETSQTLNPHRSELRERINRLKIELNDKTIDKEISKPKSASFIDLMKHIFKKE